MTLLRIYTSDFSGPRYGASSFLDYVDLRDRADVLSGLIAYWRQSVQMKSVEQAEAFITADIVKGNYFDVLGAQCDASIRLTSSGISPVSSHRSKDAGTRPAALNESINCLIRKLSPSCFLRAANNISICFFPIR